MSFTKTSLICPVAEAGLRDKKKEEESCMSAQDRFARALKVLGELPPLVHEPWKQGRLDGRYARGIKVAPASMLLHQLTYALYTAGYALGAKEREEFVRMSVTSGRWELTKELKRANLSSEVIALSKTTLALVETHIEKLWKNMDQV
jgi:hypothetical protein